MTCAQCGQENPAGFRFCGNCGAALAAAESREVRKTVTVLFCDITGSTALGERIDPEALRATTRRYFDAIRAACERHGGTVEKFIGDAAFAVFGIPRVREDDALRAVRAAAEIRAGLPDLARETGVELVFRMGVNTGEVVAGEGQTLATGDAVNVGARLEQAAQPGEILLGAETHRLVRDAVEVEALPPLVLKGKAEPVPAFRLVRVDPAAAGLARRPDAPLVGRTRELALLRRAFEHAAEQGSCQLVTVLGPAGVGKSRLVAEFLAGVDGGARVVAGRCLHYGDGITFWPLVEVLKQLGPAAEPTLARFVDEEVASPADLFWEVRKLLERVAGERPLVAVFDDIHWAEPTFLDLLDHVADLSRSAPILLLCIARPDLLDQRTGWGGGKPNSTTTLLEALSPAECELLLDELGGGLDLAARARIVAASEGNPLFVEEMAALARDEDGEVTVPPTIQALLAARIDRLPPEERATLEAGSIEGQVFHRSALRALRPEATDTELAALVRKELIRPAQSMDPADDAYAFRHGLLREAAYDALPKARRAELHEAMARWLERERAELIELDELLGYHLEQAHAYRAALGTGSADLAAQAGRHLGAAGLAAVGRQDQHAAVSLLSRAVALLPTDDPARRGLLVDLADALRQQGRLEASADRAAEAARLARAAGDAHVEARARLHELTLTVFLREGPSGMRGSIDDALRLADEARARGDDRVIAAALALAGRHTFFTGRAAEADLIASQAPELARRVGDRRVQDEALGWSAAAKLHGPTPVDEALSFVASFGDETGTVLRTMAGLVGAVLTAMAGDIEGARTEADRMLEEMEEYGLTLYRGGAAAMRSTIDLLADDYAAAERVLRHAWTLLGGLGETGFRATVGGLLAQALAYRHRLDEAEAVLAEVASFVEPDDVEPQVRTRAVRALVLAGRGEHGRALALGEQALDLAEQTDYVDLIADVLLLLAQVHAVAGRAGDARAALERAVALHERKGNVSGVAQARRRLAAVSE